MLLVGVSMKSVPMKNDMKSCIGVERYQLCLRCIREDERELDPDLQRIIRVRIRREVDWRNPLISGYTAFKDKTMPDELRVCRKCPYKLEHTVIEQKEVSELSIYGM